MKRFFKLGMVAFVLAAGGTCSYAEDSLPLTEEQQTEANLFIFNNALFVGMHEGGHMLISEFSLPVLGREEDAVDNLASVLMLEAGTEEMDIAIQDAADGWFLLSEGRKEITDEELLDEHSLDDQRAYNIVCMMTGADPEVFSTFADSLEYPEERRERCFDEYNTVRESWLGLLEPFALPEDAPGSTIHIAYEEPNADNADAAAVLRQGQLLEMLADTLGGVFDLKSGIRFTARNCGEENAYWDASTRELTFCYEFARMNADVITRFLQRESAGEK